MNKKFYVEYEEEHPGWDEFGKVNFGSMVVTAETREEAIIVFKEQRKNKYCTWTRIVERTDLN